MHMALVRFTFQPKVAKYIAMGCFLTIPSYTLGQGTTDSLLAIKTGSALFLGNVVDVVVGCCDFAAQSTEVSMTATLVASACRIARVANTMASEMSNSSKMRKTKPDPLALYPAFGISMLATMQMLRKFKRKMVTATPAPALTAIDLSAGFAVRTGK